MVSRLQKCAGAMALAVVCLLACAAPVAAACADPNAAIGVSRIVEIDTANGPIFGGMTRQEREPSFLNPKEVVLTFDDGPMPWITKSILDTLDTFCTKATFFSVGKMALSYPAMSKEVLARGHTLGSHTYTHPFNMPRMKPASAISEIEHGIAAVATAAGTPIAPFFRFTGLSDSAPLLAYLQSRGIAAFTVDVVSNDSYISDPARLADRTMAEIAQTKGGIILFHDIKRATTKALPVILARLKSEGYAVVQLKAKGTIVPLEDAMRDVAPKLTRTHAETTAAAVQTAPAVATPAISDDQSSPVTRPPLEVTSISPTVRDRTAPPKHGGKGSKPTALALKRSVVETAKSPVVQAGASHGDARTWPKQISRKSVRRSKAYR